MTIFYILAAIIIVGLTTLVWRKLQGSDNWERDASFFVDLLAMGATALIVGVLAFNQLSDAPNAEATDLTTAAVVTEAAPTEASDAVAVASSVTPTAETTATTRATRTPRATETADAATATAEPTAEPTAEATETTAPSASTTQNYTVKSGDRLAAIAEAYGVTTEQIAAANPGLDIDNLQVGQLLVIPSASAPSGTPVPASGSSSGSSPRTYTVQSGDYLRTIADRFGVTAAAIVAANPGIDSDNLQVGQVLIIP